MIFHHIHDPHGNPACTGLVPVSFVLQVQEVGPLPTDRSPLSPSSWLLVTPLKFSSMIFFFSTRKTSVPSD